MKRVPLVIGGWVVVEGGDGLDGEVEDGKLGVLNCFTDGTALAALATLTRVNWDAPPPAIAIAPSSASRLTTKLAEPVQD
jgi:hypothetical protein